MGNSQSRRSRESRPVLRCGPKDIEANQAVIVRRDTREKIVVSLDEIETKLGEILETMQHVCWRRQEHTEILIRMMQLLMKSS